MPHCWVYKVDCCSVLFSARQDMCIVRRSETSYAWSKRHRTCAFVAIALQSGKMPRVVESGWRHKCCIGAKPYRKLFAARELNTGLREPAHADLAPKKSLWRAQFVWRRRRGHCAAPESRSCETCSRTRAVCALLIVHHLDIHYTDYSHW